MVVWLETAGKVHMRFNTEKIPNFLKSALLQISRDRGLAITSIMVMFLTLFIASVFSVVLLAANSVLLYLEMQPQVTVFFKNDFPEDKVKLIGIEVKKRPDVASVRFISREDAFKFYIGQHKSEQNLLESVSSDIFPSALEIRSNKIADLELITKSFNEIEGVDEIVFFKEIINTFKVWLDAVRFVGGALVLILILISLSIILITIGMTIRSRGEEIEIMKLLGASDGYIRLPFLAQGALYGFISGLISGLLILTLAPLSGAKLSPILKDIPTPPILGFALFVSLGAIFLGVVLGVAGAWVSVKRYLKV